MAAARLAIRVGATDTASEASEAPTRIVEMVPDIEEEDEETTNDHTVSQSILNTLYNNSKSSNNTEFVNTTKKSCCVKFVLWELESNNTTENLKDMNEKSCCLDEMV